MSSLKTALAKTLPMMGMLMLPLAVCAQPRALDSEFLQKAGYLEAGPVRIYPIVAASAGYDSNIFESADDEVESGVTRFEPEVSAVLPFNTGAIQLGAQADSIIYSESSDDNVTNSVFYGRANFEPGLRNRFNFSASQKNGHEPRGTGLTEGIDPETTTVRSPDAFTDQRAALKYEFGAKNAAGRVRLATDFLDHSYDNHRERTRFFDREEFGYGATLLWRVFPRTALALEARERHIDYDERRPGEPALDSRERSAWLGAEWEATAQTEGALRVGKKRKDFDDDARTDGSDLVWETSARWRPRSYSQFELTLERAPNETNGLGDFIDTRTYGLSWTHAWRPRLATTLALGYLDQSYRNAPRSEETKSVQLGAKYTMRDWLIWRLDAVWRDRNSPFTALEFERNRVWLTAELRL